MAPDWQPLVEVLHRYEDRRFTVLGPGGNNGGDRVYRGLEKLLEHRGITFDNLAPPQYEGRFDRRKRKLNSWLEGFLGAAPFSVPDLGDPRVLLIQGGGNFHLLHGHGLTLFERLVEHYPETPIIVAPRTAWTPTVGSEGPSIHPPAGPFLLPGTLQLPSPGIGKIPPGERRPSAGPGHRAVPRPGGSRAPCGGGGRAA